MNSNIFIPKRIKVGYNERSDTYTKRLAYIIYYDEKGVLRKEKSWQSWIDQGERSRKYYYDKENKVTAEYVDYVPLPIDEFDNVPTSGFVLNKKVGDYSGDWGNHRSAYCRVYDPRNFEFEITIQNLLYILENTSSIKGKGLEGEFVYGWEGKDLILIPVSSPDYQKFEEFTEKINTPSILKAKDLVPGYTYEDKKSNQYIYLGYFNYFDYDGENKGKKHWFYGKKYSWSDISFFIQKPISSFISCSVDHVADNYANIMDELAKDCNFSPIEESKLEPSDFETFVKAANDYYRSKNIVTPKGVYAVQPSIDKFGKKDDKVYKVYTNPNNSYYFYHDPIMEGTLQEIFDYLQPLMTVRYLRNGTKYDTK